MILLITKNTEKINTNKNISLSWLERNLIEKNKYQKVIYVKRNIVSIVAISIKKIQTTY